MVIQRIRDALESSRKSLDTSNDNMKSFVDMANKQVRDLEARLESANSEIALLQNEKDRLSADADKYSVRMTSRTFAMLMAFVAIVSLVIGAISIWHH